MMTLKSARWLFALLVLSLSVNVFFIGFMAPVANALGEILSDPQAAIRSRVESAIDGLPDPYRTQTMDKYKAFSAKYNPLIDEAKKERKAILHLLLTSPVDVKQAQAQAEKLRALSAQIQEGIQDTVIDIAASLPPEQKAKIVDNSRILKALAQ